MEALTNWKEKNQPHTPQRMLTFQSLEISRLIPQRRNGIFLLHLLRSKRGLNTIQQMIYNSKQRENNYVTWHIHILEIWMVKEVHTPRNLPSTSLIKPFCHKVPRKVLLEKLNVFEWIVNISIWHRPALKPAIKHLQ